MADRIKVLKLVLTHKIILKYLPLWAVAFRTTAHIHTYADGTHVCYSTTVKVTRMSRQYGCRQPLASPVAANLTLMS